VAVLSVHHVSLIVASTEVSVDFYCNVLKLPLCNDRPELNFAGAWLQVGEQQIHLLELPNPDPVEGRPAHGGRDRHTAFLVDELAELEARLAAREIPFTRSKSGRAAIFFRDPDGNGIECIEKTAESI